MFIFPLSISNAFSLSCAPIELGDAFDDADYVFHGKVTEKNYLTFDQQSPVVTFEIVESFKGNANEQISVTVYEQWSYDFEIGLEYLVFVNRHDVSLEVSPCSPSFQAFSSTIDILRLVSTGNDLKYQTSNIFYESLTEEEKIQYEKNNEFLQEKRIERWDNALFQRNLITISVISGIIVLGIVGFVKFRKKRNR